MDIQTQKQLLKIDVQFVVGGSGEPTAVLIDMDTWNYILDRLEEAEEVTRAGYGSSKYDADNWDLEKAGYRTWTQIRETLRPPSTE